MKKELILPDTIEECHEMIKSMAFRIAQLERRAFASSLKDRVVKDDGPSLFAGLDGEAQLAAAQKLEEASREVDAAAEKRRREAKAQYGERGAQAEIPVHGFREKC